MQLQRPTEWFLFHRFQVLVPTVASLVVASHLILFHSLEGLEKIESFLEVVTQAYLPLLRERRTAVWLKRPPSCPPLPRPQYIRTLPAHQSLDWIHFAQIFWSAQPEE